MRKLGIRALTLCLGIGAVAAAATAADRPPVDRASIFSDRLLDRAEFQSVLLREKLERHIWAASERQGSRFGPVLVRADRADRAETGCGRSRDTS